MAHIKFQAIVNRLSNDPFKIRNYLVFGGVNEFVTVEPIRHYIHYFGKQKILQVSLFKISIDLTFN